VTKTTIELIVSEKSPLLLAKKKRRFLIAARMPSLWAGGEWTARLRMAIQSRRCENAVVDLEWVRN